MDLRGQAGEAGADGLPDGQLQARTNRKTQRGVLHFSKGCAKKTEEE